MFTKDILKIITDKLQAVIVYLIVIGALFFILAAAILFYPQVLQYVFIVAFFALSFMAFLIAVKIYNIKENFDRILSFIPKKKRQGKK